VWRDSIAELCRQEGIAQNLYYRWSKEFLEAGKKRLAGDTAREATSDDVRGVSQLLAARWLTRASAVEVGRHAGDHMPSGDGGTCDRARRPRRRPA
jgi:transposase-like protein